MQTVHTYRMLLSDPKLVGFCRCRVAEYVGATETCEFAPAAFCFRIETLVFTELLLLNPALRLRPPRGGRVLLAPYFAFQLRQASNARNGSEEPLLAPPGMLFGESDGKSVLQGVACREAQQIKNSRTS